MTDVMILAKTWQRAELDFLVGGGFNLRPALEGAVSALKWGLSVQWVQAL